MKKQDRYKIIDYAIKQYNNIFGLNYVKTHISIKDIEKLLKENKHSSVCEWSYCCNGVYNHCWEEPYYEGICNLTQKDVDKYILNTFKRVLKDSKKDERIAICKYKDYINVIIILRDLNKYKVDYLFTFTDIEN
jgi:hypothetical protein